MDKLSIIGVILGFAALLGGNFLEGGSWESLVNGPAALIVFGGTLGAAILQTPQNNLKRALKLFSWAIRPPHLQFPQAIRQVVAWAITARRDGILGLEKLAEVENDPFSRKALQMLADGTEPEMIRHVLETDLLVAEQRDLDASQFYESMGGYAPTIGIIGAVMGLIHVMQHLSDPTQLGSGIAVAFVATIYGVAFANLFLLPVANKLKQCVRDNSQYREMLIEGILAIADGQNPHNIEMKLSGYLP
jgi:chemotaxis protein MotA